MNRNQIRSVLLSTMLLATVPLLAQTNKIDCSKPSVLHVTKVGTDLYFQLDDKQRHKYYMLGEASQAISTCKPERVLFVVADLDVSPTEMWLPSKEQITNVRYFVQFRTGDLVEIMFGSIFPKLPVTPDIKGEPFNDDTPPPPPTKIPRGSK